MTHRSDLSQRIRRAYIDACRIDVEGFKPGNVSVFAPGHGMTARQFLDSAAASCDALCADEPELGKRIYRAVAATRDAVGCNTNLGIVLLAAPVIQAALTKGRGESLGNALSRVLSRSSRDDAEWLYQAIRLAAPGGLGTAPSEDIRRPPTVTLIEAMALASPRDRIAFQYVNGFVDILDFGRGRFIEYRHRWHDDVWAAVAVFIGFAARYRDTHIERKFGHCAAERARSEFVRLDERLTTIARPQRMIRALCMLDEKLKAQGVNPGTTADLTAASVMWVLLEPAFGVHESPPATRYDLRSSGCKIAAAFYH